MKADTNNNVEVIWGAHVSNANIWDDEAVFAGTESSPPLTSYSVSVDDLYSVMGLPNTDLSIGTHGANDLLSLIHIPMVYVS